MAFANSLHHCVLILLWICMETTRKRLVSFIRFFVVSVAICFTCQVTHAQGRADSLRSIIDQSNNDSLSWKKAVNTIRRLYASNAKEAIPFSKRLVKASRRNPTEIHVSESYQQLGITYGLSGIYDSSIIAIDSAIFFAERLKNYKELMDNYQNRGVSEDFQSKYKLAFESFLKALEIAKQHGFGKSSIYASIARTYMHTKDYVNALHYDSLAIEEERRAGFNQSRLDILRGNLASDLTAVGKYEAAKPILTDLIRNNDGRKYFLANHYEELAVVEWRTGHNNAARLAALQARRLFREADAKGEMPEIYALLAKIEFTDRRFANARDYAGEAHRLADSMHVLNVLPEVFEILANVQLVNKRFARFHFYDSLHSLYSDSLNLQEQNRAVMELNIQYESERKEKENLQLRASQLAQDAHILRQRYIIIIIALTLVVTLVLLFIIRQRNKISKRDNLMLQRKNHAIEKQAQEILSQKREIEEKNDELRETINEVKAMQTQLVHAEKMSSLGQMTAGITNEINNPLNFIAGSAQALKYTHHEFINRIRQSKAMETARLDKLDEEASSLFSALDSGVGRVSSIVASLKAFADPQQGEIQALSITEILEMSLTLLGTQLKRGNVNVVWNRSHPIPMIPLNPTQITQVFTNIIDNAIDAMHGLEHPQLVIDTIETASVVSVLIKDNGTGIPYEIQSRIMEPFFTTKPVGRGTGLGLSVSFGIIEKHNGKLTFTSEPGKGTIFIVDLPK